MPNFAVSISRTDRLAQRAALLELELLPVYCPVSVGVVFFWERRRRREEEDELFHLLRERSPTLCT